MMSGMSSSTPNASSIRPGRPGLLPVLAGLLALWTLWLGPAGGRPWFFLAPWFPDTTWKFLALAAGLAVLLHWRGGRLGHWLPAALAALLIGGQAVCARAAWGVLRGTVPWGFDHPSFMYRLKEFGDLFPGALGGYNPWWNAGTEHFVGVTSGAHGFGLLLLPLLKIWEPHVFYGAALVFWFVFAFPWLGAAAVRSAGVDRAGALCAGILMCGAGRGVFLWMWHFGTAGAMVSAMMALPATALAYRLAILRRGGWGTVLLLALSAWLLCLWTPGVFIAAGLALGWLWNFRRWTWPANRHLLGAGALALALLAPWFWTTLFPCRNVVNYIGMDLARPALATLLAGGAHRLWLAIQEWHPVLVAFGLLGALAAVPRELRRWLLPLFLVLGAVAGWSREFKPLSQLDRMAIPLAVVAVFPAAFLCGKLFAGTDADDAAGGRWRGWPRALAQGLVLATLILGFRTVRMQYANLGPAPLRTLPPEMAALADWIRTEVPPDGRLGFAGRAVHFFGGGNIAYLPVLTGREMMGDDYYGFPRGTIEYNYPPAAYRRDADRYWAFSRTCGITHWITAWPDAREFLASQPDRYEPVKSLTILDRPVDVFRVKDPAPVSRLLEGSGRVEARENRLVVFPADPAAERVVIRYNWRAGLVCRTPGAAIAPFAVDENICFIAVHPGGNARVEIGYRPHAAPIAPNFDGHFHH